MAKGISISLAAKCQLLFGLAVLVIIAGALAVPWQRMEQLAGQPTIKAARMLADAAFRGIHRRAVAATAPATSPATLPLDNWYKVSLVDLPDYPPPRIVRLQSSGAVSDTNDAITRQALESFRDHPKESEFGRIVAMDDKTRMYRFAAAVRLEKSCLACHAEYVPWVRPDSSAATAGSMPATTSRPAIGPATTAAPATWPIVAVVRADVPWQIDENQLLLNRIVIVVAGMLGGTLAIVVFYLITNRLILQPVRVLRNTAEKVAKGDLNIRSAISTGDEFQQLSETFNTMLSTLKGSRDQLEATNRSLDSRVGELAQSNVDLYEANRLKSEFLTNVSHELRTPLNAIIGFAELLSDSAVTKDPVHGLRIARYVENITTSAHQLLTLINDLLDLAKIEAGKVVLRQEKLNVADVCEAMLNFVRPLAQKKNIELSIAVQAEIPLVTTDPGRFQQILYNFLSNAIKFTPNDGKVTLAARVEPAPATPESPAVIAAQGPFVRISITDTGPGIAPEHQATIFEKFRQIDGSVTRQHPGTGLGLAISKELAQMLGGRIELLSSPGKGSTFALVLPLAPHEPVIEVHTDLESNWQAPAT